MSDDPTTKVGEVAGRPAPPLAEYREPIFTWIEWYLCERQKAGDVKARGLWEQWTEYLDHLPPAEGAPRDWQTRVGEWMQECFGPVIAKDRVERNYRFLEEALELAQSCGCTEAQARRLVQYVYSRDAGDVGQEVGGVMVTLAALCTANAQDLHAEQERELARVWTAIDKIRAKQASKHKRGVGVDNPLP